MNIVVWFSLYVKYLVVGICLDIYVVFFNGFLEIGILKDILEEWVFFFRFWDEVMEKC